jgi:hypothetical protein
MNSEGLERQSEAWSRGATSVRGAPADGVDTPDRVDRRGPRAGTGPASDLRERCR